MIIPEGLKKYDGIPCTACGEGVLEIVERNIPLVYLEVYTLNVLTMYPKCTECGAAILPRVSHNMLRANKKKAIEKVFYN